MCSKKINADFKFFNSGQYCGRKQVFVTNLVVLRNKLSSEPIPRRHIDSAPRVKFTNPINVT